MPELPELHAAADDLRSYMTGAAVQRIDATAVSVLKTSTPAYDTIVGHAITGVRTRGKYIVLTAGDLDLVLYLALAGWLRWRTPAPTGSPAMRRGPLALRLVFAQAEAEPAALDITEQGSKKSAAVWLSADADSLEPLGRLGPEADSIDERDLAGILAGTRSHLKTVLTDQRLIAGIGNAWSDEILYRARLSPFAAASRLDPAQVTALYDALRTVLDDCAQAFAGVPLDRLKAKKKSLFRVHDRAGAVCRECGATIAQVAFSDRSLQYCPGCQTGGKHLSDRRMDRLLK